MGCGSLEPGAACAAGSDETAMTNQHGATGQRSKAAPHAIESRIEAHYDRLPGSERRVAEAILDYPGHIASHSATELAQLAGASKAAVTRLIRRLGFAGYHEARRLGTLLRAMEQAREAGVPILFITDPTAGETARLADWTLRCQVRGASLFDSYVAVTSLLHLLSSVVVEQRREAGRSHLKRIEKIHDALGEFE